MAEVAAALYALETAAEGAALGAIAVGKATVPLHVRFRKIKSPSPSLARSNHSLNVIKNKAYIFGGDLEDGKSDSAVQCLTLPTDLSFKELDIDYQVIPSEAAPTRPLASYSDDDKPTQTADGNEVPSPRATHASAAVGNNIYIFGGRSPSPSTSILDEAGTIHAFSTLTKKWTTLHPHPTLCSQGLPPPRVHGVLTSSPHPTNSKFISTSTDTEHNTGTLFLHSGYLSSTSQTPLRDIWTFDISSRVWSPWPSLPPPSPTETSGEGNLLCSESRLWRVGDGFGCISYLDIVRDSADDAWGDKGTELGVSPKTGQWGKIAPSPTEESLDHPTDKASILPLPRRDAGWVPITTGAGRTYLLYFLGADAPNSPVQDIWSFQIVSEANSLARTKDKIRGAVGVKSGENQWAKCEVVEATKEDGELERPMGLEGFACDGWGDFGGGVVVLWGGREGGGGGVRNEGWVMSVT